ncbi:hypothetical protein ABR737_15045 [Streptomyces sp. Edi2]|uniref:hypothetical protein n=1 Tax=Streptomyces sp. Edi2 TaxID=3162528 RepID=UPI003305B18B
MTLGIYGRLFPDRLDEVSEKMHKRRAHDLAKPKAKAKKAEKALAELVQESAGEAAA